METDVPRCGSGNGERLVRNDRDGSGRITGAASARAASADRADVAEQILEESGFAATGGGLVAHHGDVHDILHAVPRDVAHRALRIALDDKHHLLTRLGPVETELARFPPNIIPGVLVELRLDSGAPKRTPHRIPLAHPGPYPQAPGGRPPTRP